MVHFVKEFVLTVECSAEDGSLTTISTYIVPCGKMSKRMMHIAYGGVSAEWCGDTGAFTLLHDGKRLHPTEPVLLPEISA